MALIARSKESTTPVLEAIEKEGGKALAVAADTGADFLSLETHVGFGMY